MQLLTSALPGFRDLRAPLTAGYLWLLLLWITLKPNLTVRPSNEIAGSVYDLGRSVDPIWVGLGISVAAYLIGSVSQSLSPVLGGTIGALWRAIRKLLVRAKKKIQWLPVSRIASPQSPIGKYWDQAVEVTAKLNMPEGADKKAEAVALNKAEALVAHLADEAGNEIERDISLPATLLLGHEPQLFTEADRLKAEVQFRLAVVPPLVALALTTSWDQSPWWLLSLLPVVILLWQSNTRNLEYRQLMFGAVEREIIQSRGVDRFRALAGEAPSRSSTDSEKNKEPDLPPTPKPNHIRPINRSTNRLKRGHRR